MNNKFEITIKSLKGKKEVIFPEDFPKDLHEDDIYYAIKEKIGEQTANSSCTLSREEIHKIVEGEFGNDTIAKWGDHSHGINSADRHSHN